LLGFRLLSGQVVLWYGHRLIGILFQRYQSSLIGSLALVIAQVSCPRQGLVVVHELTRNSILIIKTQVLQIIINIFDLFGLLLRRRNFLQTFEAVLITPLHAQQLLNLRIIVNGQSP